MNYYKLLIILILLISLFSALRVNTELVEENPQPTSDCTYLITILEKTINYTTTLDYAGELVAYIMLNTPIDPSLQALHRQVYKLIVDYYIAVNSTSININLLRDIYRGIDTIVEYTRKLQACSRSPEVANVRARIELKLRDLKSRLEELITLHSTSSQQVSVYILEKIYEPSEEVYVQVVLLNNTCSVNTISLLYRDIIIETNSFNCNGSKCIAILKIPSANSIQNILEAGIVKYTIAIRGVCSGVEFKIYRFLSSQYEYPQLIIETPMTIIRGGILNITLYTTSSGVLSGVLLVKNSINETLLANITITNTPREYEIIVDKPYFTTGLNILKLCVNATEKTLPYCLEKSIIVEPKYPSINVNTVSTSITLTGNIPLYIISASEFEYDVQVYLNNKFIAESKISNRGVETIVLSSGFSPLSIVNLTVIIRDPRGVLDNYVYSTLVISVNISTLLVILIGGSTLLVILREYERSLILSLRTSSMRVISRVKREVSGLLESVLKPYVLGLGSRVAELYYTLLRKLGIRLPHQYETLREHYAEAISSITRKNTIRELLWRILVLTERDLYSQRKPRIEDVEKLYKGVLSESSEE